MRPALEGKKRCEHDFDTRGDEDVVKSRRKLRVVVVNQEPHRSVARRRVATPIGVLVGSPRHCRVWVYTPPDVLDASPARCKIRRRESASRSSRWWFATILTILGNLIRGP